MSALILVLGLVTGSIAARSLGVESRGMLAIVLFVGQFIPYVTLLGYSDAVVSTTEPGSGQRTIKLKAIGIATANSAIVFLLFVAPIFLYLRSFGELIAVWGAIFFAIQLLDLATTHLISGAYRAAGRFAALDAFRIGLPLVYAASMISLLMAAPSALWFIKLNVVAVAIIVILKLINLIKFIDFEGVSPTFARRAIFFYVVNIGFVVSSQLDRMFVISFMSKTEVGLFVVAATIAGPFQNFLTQAMRTITMPSFAGIIAEKKAEALQDGLTSVWLISLLSAFFVAMTGPFVVLLVFGSEFRSAAWLVPMLAFTLVLAPIRGLIAEVLKTEIKRDRIYLIELVYISLFCLTFLLSHWAGIAWAVLPAFFVANLGSALFAAREASLVYGFSTLAWLKPDWATMHRLAKRAFFRANT